MGSCSCGLYVLWHGIVLVVYMVISIFKDRCKLDCTKNNSLRTKHTNYYLLFFESAYNISNLIGCDNVFELSAINPSQVGGSIVDKWLSLESFNQIEGRLRSKCPNAV